MEEGRIEKLRKINKMNDKRKDRKVKQNWYDEWKKEGLKSVEKLIRLMKEGRKVYSYAIFLSYWKRNYE